MNSRRVKCMTSLVLCASPSISLPPLALKFWGVRDPCGLFSLSDRQAEVSFKLCKKWRTEAGRDMSGSAEFPCEIMLSLPADCSFLKRVFGLWAWRKFKRSFLITQNQWQSKLCKIICPQNILSLGF